MRGVGEYRNGFGAKEIDSAVRDLCCAVGEQAFASTGGIQPCHTRVIDSEWQRSTLLTGLLFDPRDPLLSVLPDIEDEARQIQQMRDPFNPVAVTPPKECANTTGDSTA